MVAENHYRNVRHSEGGLKRKLTNLALAGAFLALGVALGNYNSQYKNSTPETDINNCQYTKSEEYKIQEMADRYPGISPGNIKVTLCNATPQDLKYMRELGF